MSATTGECAYTRLHATVEASVKILAGHLPAVALLLRVRGNSELEQAALRRRRKIDRQLAKLVQQAVREGHLRDDIDSDLASRLIFGLVNSVVEWYQPDGHLSPSRLADAVASLVFDGLRGNQA